MITKRLAVIVTAAYLGLAAGALVYELGIRLRDRGNSEFAGMLTVVMTLPASVLVIAICKAIIGVSPGDSDAAFAMILGLSALANAGLLWGILTLLGRRQRGPGARSRSMQQ